MIDIGIGYGEGVGLERQKGDTRHSQEGTLTCRPAKMIRPAEREAYKARSGDFSFGIEGAEAGLEAEVRVVEDDDANGANESIEAP